MKFGAEEIMWAVVYGLIFALVLYFAIKLYRDKREGKS